MERHSNQGFEHTEEEPHGERTDGQESRMIYPVLNRLRNAQIEVDSLEELVQEWAPLSGEITEILLASLPEVQNQRGKETIIRALAASNVAFDGEPLKREFEQSENVLFQWAIGNTLAEAQPTGINDWMVQVLTTPDYGKAREMFGIAVARHVPAPRAVPALISALKEMPGHAAMGLKELSSNPAAKAAVKPLMQCREAARGWEQKRIDQALKAIEES